MSTNDPFAFLEQSAPLPARKPTRRPTQWKEKLFNKDKQKKEAKAADQQIEAFLGPTRTQSISHGHAIPHPLDGPRDQPTLPNLELNQSWPPALDSSSTSPQHAKPPAADFRPSESMAKPPHKSRPRRGTKVRFSEKQPELMGEGGDESEIPTAEMCLCRDRARQKQDDGSAPPLRVDTSGEKHRPLRRQDTTARKPPQFTNAQDADLLMALGGAGAGSRLSFRASPESSSFAQQVRDKMQAEEGRALHHHYDDPQEDDGQPAPDSPSSSYETPPLSETEPVPPPNPFRDTSSPEKTYSPEKAYSSEKAYSPEKAYSSEKAYSPEKAYRPEKSYRPEKNSPMASPVESLPSGLAPGGSLPNPNPSPPKYQPVRSGPVREESSRPSTGDTTGSRNAGPKFSLRTVANQFNDTAFTDLKNQAETYSHLIQQAAESVKPLMETSLAEWMRAAVWWFLRGKRRLEAYARASRSGSGGRPEDARQAVVDLCKALWIIETIVPVHGELTRYGAMGIEALLAVVSTTGDRQLADLLSLHQTMLNHLRSLAMSIKRNNIIDTIMSAGDAGMRVDTTLWVRYPFFAPDVSAVLSGAATRSMLLDKSGKSPSLVHMMPLSDTNLFFTYGSMFVKVYVSSNEDDGQQQFSIPCVLSIIRNRADWYVCAAISSQSELVNVMIQSDRKKGPTWEDVDWQVRSHSMGVKLPRGFELDIVFDDEDFKNLWNIVQYTQKTEASYHREAGETMVFENVLKSFSYMDPGSTRGFPAEPVERCRLRLFERTVTLTEGTGTRSAHRGFRLAVLTSPKFKTLSSVRHMFGQGAPIVFGLLRGVDGAPALALKVTEDGRTRTMLMTFHEVPERTALHSFMLGMIPQEGEIKTPDIPIRAYSIEQPADKLTGSPARTHLQFPAGTVSVIDQEHGYVEHGYGPTILSEALRAFIATEWGSATDRINLGPGELRLGLDINNRTGLSLYRPAQQDLTVSVAENLVSPEMPERLTEFLQLAQVKPTVRRFDFATVKDLHRFQRAVTGFQVLFDSVASSLSISRRRMVVPIHKKWEANLARIQIVQQDKVIQLIAFLNDFNHGKCMNFVLKGTDTLESFGRPGKFGVRVLDAKFALPRTDDDPTADYVCLDMPEYPLEHDDITIVFDSEEDRTNFQTAAPGSVRETSRMSSLRR